MPWNIPEAVWPIPPGRVKERPWWSVVCVRGYFGWIWGATREVSPESANVQVNWDYPENATPQAETAARAQGYAELLTKLEAYDREHPRPRPPYRAGQVWGTADGGTWTVLKAQHGLACRVDEYSKDTTWVDVPCAALLFDPLDPNAAPWSPE